MIQYEYDGKMSISTSYIKMLFAHECTSNNNRTGYHIDIAHVYQICITTTWTLSDR